MARNYVALQNFLNDSTSERRQQRGGSYSKGVKRRERRRLLIHAQGGKCVDCRMKFPFDGERYHGATADHVIPYRFGSTLCHNVEFVCAPCNQKREANRMQAILNYFGTIS